ncbi:reverse transcriptase domain-containing protein [Tanacetum coccineum]
MSNMLPNNDNSWKLSSGGGWGGGLPRSIEGNVTASKPQTLEEAINIAQRLMDQVTKHALMQVSSENKRKFDDRRSFNNSSRSNNNYRNTNNRYNNRQQQNRRQEAGRAYAVTPSKNGRSWLSQLSQFHQTHPRRVWGHRLDELSCSALSLPLFPTPHLPSPPTTHTDTTVTRTEIPIVLPTAPPSPDHTPASSFYSPTSDTEADPSKDPSSDHIPPLPAISPFLSLADDTTDNDTPDTPPSPTHGTPFTEITPSTHISPIVPRRRVMILAPGQPIPYRRPYRYHLNGPLHMLTARKRVGPLPTHRLDVRHSVNHSSSDYFSPDDSARDSSSDSSSEASSDFHLDASSNSSSRHSLSDHSSLDLRSTSAGPSRKRYRSPMTYVPALSPTSGALSPIRGDLIPSPKRVRDSDYFADVEEHEIDPVQATIEVCFDFADIIRSRGIDVRVVAKTVAWDKIKTDTRDIFKGGDDRVTHPVIEGVQREQGRRIVGVELAVTALTERIAELERITGGSEAPRVLRVREKMPNTRFGASMTHEEIEDLVSRRVAEEMEAREAAINLEPLNESGDEQEVARECTFQDFLKCKPHNFLGTEGVDSALTWWNSHKRTIGVDATYVMKWAGLMKLMTEELILLCNRMVPDEEDRVERFIGGTVFREPPCPFDYPIRRLTMEETLAKFIDEGRHEHEEMEIFIKEFRTTNELLLKTRSNLLSELKIKVNELSKVVSNVLIPKNKIKGVTTRGGKITSKATRSKEINEIRINENEPPRFEQSVQEKPHDDGEKNKSSSIRERTTQPLVKPQQSSVPFPNWVRKEKEEALQRFFLENLKKLNINISFIEAPVQIPKHAKYLKSLLTNKSRLKEACTKTTNERCSTILLNELPSKEKDPKSFTIPCQVLEKHKEAEDLAANHLSRFENPHMEVLTEREIVDKFSDEYLMALKFKSNNDEPWYADFVNYIVGKVVPPSWTFEKKKRFFSQVKTYFWEEPYTFKLCADNIMRRCVAGSETLEILAHCHSGPTCGHHSANITAKKVYEFGFYWPSVFKDANEGNKYLLVAIDYVSKWVEAQALPTNDARVVVKFLRRLFARFGVPKALISDRGTHFCNYQLEKALQRYGVTHKLSTTYHPQSNGQTKVTNRAIKCILERSVGYNLKDWSKTLNNALWAFRTTYKTPTGCAPFRLVYRKACHLPVEIEHKAHWALKQCNMDLTLASESHLMQLNELVELRDGAYENTRIYKERTKKWHDSRLRGDKDFKVGDKVSIRRILGNGYGVSTSCTVLGPRERNIDEYWWRIYKSGDLEVLES